MDDNSLKGIGVTLGFLMASGIGMMILKKAGIKQNTVKSSYDWKNIDGSWDTQQQGIYRPDYITLDLQAKAYGRKKRRY